MGRVSGELTEMQLVRMRKDNVKLIPLVMRLLAAMLIGGLALTLPVRAASFDCAKAGTKVEHIICDNPAISKLDDDVARAYKAALQSKGNADAIRQEQKQWLKSMSACLDGACVKQAYEMRLLQLKDGQKTKALVDAGAANNSYDLVYGKGDLLCEEMYKRLNAEARKSPNGPICGLDLLKTIPGVALPFSEWKRLDLKVNKRLYMKFVLSFLVERGHYQEIISKHLSGPADQVDFIHIPRDQILLTAYQSGLNLPRGPLEGGDLDRFWREAIDHGYEFYRWDGVFGAPNEGDVLVIEVSRFNETYRQDSCPTVKMVRFPGDLSVPRQWQLGGSKWLFGSDLFPFSYAGRYFSLEEVVSQAPQLSNGVSIRSASDKNYRCDINGNYFFPAE